MTWNPRRKGWMGQLPREAAPVPASEEASTGADGSAVRVPAFPMFSPAAIASLLHLNRGMVHYYLEKQKLEFVRDNIGERYVLRPELIRFIREYLQRGVHE